MSSREVTRFKRDLVNIHESFKSNCGVYAETLADCNNTWCYQEGTARQYTSCSSVSSDGFTCNNPTIRYGSSEGGIPGHSWGSNDDDLTSWCTQLLRRPSAGSVTRGVRSCAAPLGSVYWGTGHGNDEAGPRWLDSTDGNWRDSTLDSHRCNLFNYYITSLTCTSSFIMQRGNMIRTLPTIQKEYAISFKVLPTKFSSGWHSVIHFTTGGDLDVYGSRIPGVWFRPEGGGSLYICSAVNGNKDFCSTPATARPLEYPLNELTEVRISQKMDGDDYFYTIKINGITVVRVQNNQPEVFSNVKVYMGDPWHPAQEGYIQDLVINTGS